MTAKPAPKPDCFRCFSENIKGGICRDCGADQDGPIGMAPDVRNDETGWPISGIAVHGRPHYGQVPHRDIST